MYFILSGADIHGSSGSAGSWPTALAVNPLRKPFTRNGIRCRFKRLRQKLPHLKGLIAYVYRHSFATDVLVNGVGIAQVAELLGHTNGPRRCAARQR